MPYLNLTVIAARPNTEIYLADDDGSLVQKDIGEMFTSLLPGKYVVHFGIGGTKIKVDLQTDMEVSE